METSSTSRQQQQQQPSQSFSDIVTTEDTDSVLLRWTACIRAPASRGLPQTPITFTVATAKTAADKKDAPRARRLKQLSERIWATAKTPVNKNTGPRGRRVKRLSDDTWATTTTRKSSLLKRKRERKTENGDSGLLEDTLPPV